MISLLLVVLGCALYLLGTTATALWAKSEKHSRSMANWQLIEKMEKKDPEIRWAIFWLFGFLSNIPLIVFFLIVLSNYTTIFGG